MIRTVGENKTTFVVSTKNMVVSSILDNGAPIFGGSYLEFSSIDQVRSYLTVSAQICIQNGTYSIFENHNYEVAAIRQLCDKIYTEPQSALIKTFNEVRNFSTEFQRNLATSCVVIAVREGFAKIGLETTEKVQELLNDVKYKSIIEDYIPSYVQENIENFINVGTTTCSGKDKGAIMLTSPDDLLERINFQ